VIDILVKLTRPTMKKLLKLYMSDDCGNNKIFVKKAIEIAKISQEESYLIWQIFDIAYEFWFLRKQE
jgi:hypothetical protein